MAYTMRIKSNNCTTFYFINNTATSIIQHKIVMMFKNIGLSFVILSVLLLPPSSACSESSGSSVSMEHRYGKWMARHQKEYGSREEQQLRFGIYKSNVEFIDSINLQHLPYKLTDNEYADMTNEEFQATFMGFKSMEQTGVSECIGTENLTAAVDWRKEGAVTPVKNQGDCGMIYS